MFIVNKNLDGRINRGSELERWADSVELDAWIEIGVMTTLDIGSFDARAVEMIEAMLAA